MLEAFGLLVGRKERGRTGGGMRFFYFPQRTLYVKPCGSASLVKSADDPEHEIFLNPQPGSHLLLHPGFYFSLCSHTLLLLSLFYTVLVSSLLFLHEMLIKLDSWIRCLSGLQLTILSLASHIVTPSPFPGVTIPDCRARSKPFAQLGVPQTLLLLHIVNSFICTLNQV